MHEYLCKKKLFIFFNFFFFIYFDKISFSPIFLLSHNSFNTSQNLFPTIFLTLPKIFFPLIFFFFFLFTTIHFLTEQKVKNQNEKAIFPNPYTDLYPTKITFPIQKKSSPILSIWTKIQILFKIDGYQT